MDQSGRQELAPGAPEWDAQLNLKETLHSKAQEANCARDTLCWFKIPELNQTELSKVLGGEGEQPEGLESWVMPDVGVAVRIMC